MVRLTHILVLSNKNSLIVRMDESREWIHFVDANMSKTKHRVQEQADNGYKTQQRITHKPSLNITTDLPVVSPHAEITT